jgi:peptide chain release factor 2
MRAEAQGHIDQINAATALLRRFLDWDRALKRLDELNAKVEDPGLWDDPKAAQEVMRERRRLEEAIGATRTLERELADTSELIEMAESEGDSDLVEDGIRSLAELAERADRDKVAALLAGEADANSAYVEINAGAGGTESQDWAEMLLRMYTRWAERHGYPTEIYDTSYAEEAGIKSATFAVKSPYAYGTLSVEQGTHRLVRISPFDNQGRRQTSFAGVEVLPVVEQTDHVDIDESDLRVDVYRSSGPGGQGVNTTDSAVRLTHIPTGIVVSCQNERSQIQNKATAMAVLQAKLLEKQRQEERARMDALKGDGSSWGNQMRSYVLHPYQMVKDLRTEHEVGNPQSVLDGDIDGFIEAGIRWRKQQQTVA